MASFQLDGLWEAMQGRQDSPSTFLGSTAGSIKYTDNR